MEKVGGYVSGGDVSRTWLVDVFLSGNAEMLRQLQWGKSLLRGHVHPQNDSSLSYYTEYLAPWHAWLCQHATFALLLFFFFLNNRRSLFIYLWLCWIFVAAHRLSLVAASGGYSLLWCADFSLQWFLLLQSVGSRRTGFSSCGAWAQ